jgi:hypothetical protein
MRDTIDMAREAGFVEYELEDYSPSGYDIRYERFAALVRADERALAAPVQEPVAWVCYGFGGEGKHTIDYDQAEIDAIPVGTLLYTTPPAAQQEPAQVSPLEFVTMVMEKEHLVGKPLFWAEWPNKEIK